MLLNKYNKDQPIASKTLVQAILNNRISHAYLFETNEYYESNDFIISFVKDIIFSDNNSNENDNINIQIDNNEYLELKIINTQGSQIKKEEILNLQEEFKNKPIEGKKRIYIINNAEKFNSSSANTILKFLEEPEDNIIAILVTNNRYQIIDTILSRCQLITLINSKKEETTSMFDKINNLVYNKLNYLDENQKKEQIIHAISFVNFYEEKLKETLLFSNREFIQYFSSRDAVINAFEIIKLFYLDVLKIKTTGKIENFVDYNDLILDIANKNSISKLTVKISKIIKYIERIKYNVNINLFIDSFIIELGD